MFRLAGSGAERRDASSTVCDPWLLPHRVPGDSGYPSTKTRHTSIQPGAQPPRGHNASRISHQLTRVQQHRPVHKPLPLSTAIRVINTARYADVRLTVVRLHAYSDVRRCIHTLDVACCVPGVVQAKKIFAIATNVFRAPQAAGIYLCLIGC